MFDQRRLDSGEGIYLGHEIDHIEKTEEGFKAIAHGTDDYDVEIKLNGRDIPEMSCDCHYARIVGSNCKHMAALMFAITGMQEKAETETASDPVTITFEDILAGMTEDQLREELAVLAAENDSLRKKLEEKYTPDPITQEEAERIGYAFQFIAEDYQNSGGIIDWKHGHDYADEFKEELKSAAGDLIRRGDYRSAFTILDHAFFALDKSEMDGSFGEYDEVISLIKSYWKTIIAHSSQKERERIHEWFLDMDRYSIYIQHSYSIHEMLEECFGEID